LAVHQNSIAVAGADGGGGEAAVVATVANDRSSLDKCPQRLGPPAQLRVCYEAGPTGYDRARRLNGAGVSCTVVAPALVPQDGRRVKTDRKGAVKLAHFLRAGSPVAITVPDPRAEALRDLERARGDAKNAERVAPHQLDKFLLRHGRSWRGGRKWTQKPQAWVRAQAFAEPALQRVHADAVTTVEPAGRRVAELTAALTGLLPGWSREPLVRALQARRGVQVVTAVVLAAEVGDYRRFRSPRQLMAYLGLVPSEHSSGARRRRGRITRTGNGHVRRLPAEAAWHYRHRARVTTALAARSAGVAAGVKAIAWKAQQRLHRRYLRLLSRGKGKQQTVTALARESAGFVWALAQEEELVEKAG
jgi:transposase